MPLVLQNLHTHTTFCDGNNSVDEMCKATLACGLTSLGFSGHAYTPHDESWCMKLGNYAAYREAVLAARKAYQGRLEVYLGLEQDYYSIEPGMELDFIIGSVHYVKKGDEYVLVDETRQDIENAVNRLYSGDIYAFLEDYYSLVGDVHNKTKCNIVGHIDLCEKFNRDAKLFDRESPRYKAAYEKAVDKLVSQGMIFEINTGAMSRGYADVPYPHPEVLKYIAKCGGRVTISSDSHSIDTVNFMLDEMLEYAVSCGINGLYALTSNGFVPIPIDNRQNKI